MVNQAFDIVMQHQHQSAMTNDRDSIYLDAISLSSDKNSIGMSRQSIYHSINDMHFAEDETSMNMQNSKNDKVRFWGEFQASNTSIDSL